MKITIHIYGKEHFNIQPHEEDSLGVCVCDITIKGRTYGITKDSLKECVELIKKEFGVDLWSA